MLKGHPGILGMLYFTYLVPGRTESLSGMLNSVVVWVLECRESCHAEAQCWREYSDAILKLKKKKKSQNVFYVLKVKVLIENWNKVPPPAVLHSM